MHSSINGPACAWAFSNTAPSPHAKLLLLTIAAYADQDGLSKISIAQLADISGMSLRGVQNVLGHLERAHLIAGERSPGVVTAYRIDTSGAAAELPGAAEAVPTRAEDASVRAAGAQGEVVMTLAPGGRLVVTLAPGVRIEDATSAPAACHVVSSPAPAAGAAPGVRIEDATPAPAAGHVVSSPAPAAGQVDRRARVESDSDDEEMLERTEKEASKPVSDEVSETPPLPPQEIPEPANDVKAEIGGRMRIIWNTVTAECPHFLPSKWLTPKLLQTAVNRFNHEFKRDFAKWEAYCGRLIKNAFLRGERQDDRNWRPSIEWAIQADTVLREAEGRYPPDPEAPPPTPQAEKEVHPTADPIWGKPNRIKLQLAREMARPVINDHVLQQLSRDYKAALEEARAAQAALNGGAAHV